MKKGIIWFLNLYVKYYPIFLSLFLMIGVYITNNHILERHNLLPMDYKISSVFVMMFMFASSFILYIISDITLSVIKDKDKDEQNK